MITLTIDDRKVEVQEGSTVLETEDLSWTPSPAISPELVSIGNNQDVGVFVPLPDVRTVTRGSTSYSTNHDYSSSNFADYGQPNSIAENGSLDRTT